MKLKTLNSCLLTLCIAAIPALATSSTKSEMYLTQALFSISDEDYELALVRLDLAVKDDPEDVRARYYRGMSYSRVGQYAAAITDLKQVKGNEDLRQQATYELGFAYYRNKQLQLASAELAQASSSNPQHAPSNYYYGLVAYLEEDYEISIKPLRAVVKNKEFGSSAAYLAGDSLINLNRYHEARAVLDSGIRDYPDSVYVNASMALLNKIDSQMSKTKNLVINLFAGGAYDGNVGLFPDASSLPLNSTNDSDYRFQYGMDARYRVHQSKKSSAHVSYRFFESNHSTLSQFDVRNHTLMGDLRSKITEVLDGGISLQLSASYLNRLAYSETQVLNPYLTFHHSKKRFSMLRLQIRENRFLQTGASARNGSTLGTHYRQYILRDANKGHFFFGFERIAEGTDDKEFQYTQYAAEWGMTHKADRATTFKGSLKALRKFYDLAATKREDNQYIINIGLSYAASKNTHIDVSATNISAPSSQLAYRYNRSIFSFTVRHTL